MPTYKVGFSYIGSLPDISYVKKFTRCLTNSANDREVLNVNSIASERTAFRFMRDQQKE
jgi:hypothetical protein